MAAYDNVSLPGAPNIATAGNYAQLLYEMTHNTQEDARKNADFQYQQQQRNLFASGVPTDANGQPDYGTMMRRMIQSGGAPTAGQVLPMLQKQPFLNEALRQMQEDNGGGGQPSPVNTSSPNQTATGLDNASKRLEGGAAATYPRIPYAGASEGSLSAGTDNAGRKPTIRQMAIDSGVDPTMPGFAQAFAGTGLDRELTSPSVIAAAQKRISQFKTSGVSPQSPPAATNDPASAGRSPITSAEVNQGNEQTPVVGGQGGSQISPAPTAAAGGAAPASFNQRFGAATGNQPVPAAGPPQPTGPQVAQAPTAQATGGAAAMVPPAYRDNPLRWADILDKRAEGASKIAKAKAIAGIPATADEERVKQYSKEADAIREQLGKAGELTTEQKNLASGAAERAEQIKSDAKYYDSLHRGLVGSGMIAAQQKQNVDILRQVAASPNFVPGAGSDVALAYQRIAAQFGINPTSAAPREIFNQVAARILADQFSGMKSMSAETGETGGRLFKSMLDIEEKANITADDSLAGIKAKLDIIDKTGDLMMRWADLASDYKIKHGKLDAGFDKELRADIATKGRVPNVVPKAGPPLKAGRYKWTPEGGMQSVQ